MIDFDEFPEGIYNELASLVGESKAEAIIRSAKYKLYIVERIIMAIYIRRLFVEKKKHLLILLLLVLIIYGFYVQYS